MVKQNIVIVLWWLTMYAKLYFYQCYGLYCVNSKIYCVLQCLGALNSWSGRWMLDDVCKSDVWPVDCICEHACGASYATQLLVPLVYHHKRSGQCRVSILKIAPIWNTCLRPWQDTFARNTGTSTCVYTHICGTSAMDHMTKLQRLDRKYQSSVKEESVRQYYMEIYDNT